MEEKTLSVNIRIEDCGIPYIKIDPICCTRSNGWNGTEIALYLNTQLKAIEDKFPLTEFQIIIEITETANPEDIKKIKILIKFEKTVEKPEDFIGLVIHSTSAALRAMDCSAKVTIK